MLDAIRKAIKAYFENATDLDRFVSSKRPSSSAEVNYWVREFERMQYNRRPYF